MNNNERQIMPLRRYEISFTDGDTMPVSFTADDMQYDSDSYRFYNAGNLIRLIVGYKVEQVVVTPVE